MYRDQLTEVDVMKSIWPLLSSSFSKCSTVNWLAVVDEKINKIFIKKRKINKWRYNKAVDNNNKVEWKKKLTNVNRKL